MLRPRYAALTQDRLYVVEHERPVRHDVSVVQTVREETAPTAAWPVQADRPVIVELVEEEIRQPLIHIVEPAAGNRLVTAIEVLSPDNKRPGAGRDQFLRKRDELWKSGAHLVEIDLLREGWRTLRVSEERPERMTPWCYVVSVSRQPGTYELYLFSLQERLPRLRVPLAHDDPDVVLDLQVPFDRSWQAGPYPGLLRYDGPPPGRLSEDDLAWCRERVREAETGSSG
jgi:hypothetical protein